MSDIAAGQSNSHDRDVAGLPVVSDDGANTYVYGFDLVSANAGGSVQTHFLRHGLASTTDLSDGRAKVVATCGCGAIRSTRAEGAVGRATG